MPVPTNIRVDGYRDVQRGRRVINKMLVGGGRILVPADGWYKWKALGTGLKAPQAALLHTRGWAAFFAGLSGWSPGDEKDEAHGFAIVTNDALGVMIDVHDRCPVALPPELAIHWIFPTFPRSRRLNCCTRDCPRTRLAGIRCDGRLATRSINCPTLLTP
ncbi:hypothetical protein G6F31_016544 [Rhizopus arrhizus]|nr:hypothetical protein G6F31_016544 [Rhizopus arrhizus]